MLGDERWATITQLHPMGTKRFWLQPFEPLSNAHSLDIVGRVSRDSNVLTVSYEILGALHLLLPPNIKEDKHPSAQPKGTHPKAPAQKVIANLYKERASSRVHNDFDSDSGDATCLKFYVSPQTRSHYWEFRLSPDSDWIDEFSKPVMRPSAWDFKISSNQTWTVSRFENYRESPQHVQDIKTTSYSMMSTPKALHTLLKIDLTKLLSPNQALCVGIAAVTRQKDNLLAHWALNHPTNAPDSHHPASFSLSM